MSHDLADPKRTRFEPWFAGLTLLVGVASGLLVAYRRCFASEYEALATSIADDTYYYLLPALRLRTHGFFTFDGLNPTYGFQPLWELVLAGLAFVVREREPFLRAALFLAHALRLLTGVLLFAAVARGFRTAEGRAPWSAATLAASLWLVHVPFLYSGTQGKENALFSALVAIAVLLVVRDAANPVQGKGGDLLLGVLLGALVLTRLTPTSLVFAGALGAVVVIRRRPAAGGILAGAVPPVLAWCCYAYAAHGTVFPVSGVVKVQNFRVYLRSFTAFWNEIPAMVSSAAYYLGQEVLFSLAQPSAFTPGSLFPSVLWSPSVGAILAALFAAWFLFGRKWREADMSTRRVLLLLSVTFVASAVTPILLHHRRQELFYASWYVTEVPLLTCVALALPFVQLRHRAGALITAGCLVFVSADAAKLAPVLGELPPIDHARLTFQQAALRAAQYLNDELRLGPEHRVGARDAGLLGYFARATVVNLDGLANDVAFEHYMSKRTMIEYARDARLEYYVGVMVPGGWFNDHFAHFELMHRLELDWAPAGYYVARITDEPFPPSRSHVRGSIGRIEFHAWADLPVFGRTQRTLFLHPGENGPTEVEFELWERYERFEATAAILEDAVGGISRRHGRAGIRLFADGKSVGEWVIDVRELPRKLSVDVRGVKRLRLEVNDADNGVEYDWLYLVNVGFTRRAALGDSPH